MERHLDQTLMPTTTDNNSRPPAEGSKLSRIARHHAHQDLPLDVVQMIVRRSDPRIFGLLKFVSRDFRDAVGHYLLVDGNDDAVDCRGSETPEPSTTIRITDMCSSPELLAWAFSKGCPIRDERVCNVAVVTGGSETLKVARLNGCEWSSEVSRSACEVGDARACQWAYENGCPFDDSALEAAAFGGHVDIMDWLLKTRIDPNPKTRKLTTREPVSPDYGSPLPVAAAAEGGSLRALQWLRNRGFAWSALACEVAAKEGHVDVLEWCIEHGCPLSSDVSSAAASGGHIHVLRLLLDKGCPFDTGACTAAARSGSLAVLEFARGRGLPWSATACEAAASEGRLEALEWCRRNGCEWNADATWAASQEGHLSVLKFLIGNGCPCDHNIALVAYECGYDDVVDWPRDSRIPCPLVLRVVTVIM